MSSKPIYPSWVLEVQIAVEARNPTYIEPISDRELIERLEHAQELERASRRNTLFRLRWRRVRRRLPSIAWPLMWVIEDAAYHVVDWYLSAIGTLRSCLATPGNFGRAFVLLPVLAFVLLFIGSTAVVLFVLPMALLIPIDLLFRLVGLDGDSLAVIGIQGHVGQTVFCVMIWWVVIGWWLKGRDAVRPGWPDVETYRADVFLLNRHIRRAKGGDSERGELSYRRRFSWAGQDFVSESFW